MERIEELITRPENVTSKPACGIHVPTKRIQMIKPCCRVQIHRVGMYAIICHLIPRRRCYAAVCLWTIHCLLFGHAWNFFSVTDSGRDSAKSPVVIQLSRMHLDSSLPKSPSLSKIRTSYEQPPKNPKGDHCPNNDAR